MCYIYIRLWGWVSDKKISPGQFPETRLLFLTLFTFFILFLMKYRSTMKIMYIYIYEVFVKDSMSKRKKMSFLFNSLPWLSNGILWGINKLKQGLWCTICRSYIYIIYSSIYITVVLKKYSTVPNSCSFPQKHKLKTTYGNKHNKKQPKISHTHISNNCRSMYPMLHQSIALLPTNSQNSNIYKNSNQGDLGNFSPSHLP